MTATATPETEIDPALRRDPAALAAVTDGTRYLRSRPGFDAAGLGVRWRATGDPAAPAVTVELFDGSGDLELVGRQSFPAAHLLNPVYRDIWAIRAYRELLGKRMDRREREIWRLIHETEDADDGGPVQRP